MNRQQRRRQIRLTRQNGAPLGAASGTGKAPANALDQALAIHKSGRPQDALQAYRRILATRPNQADVLNFAGVAAFQAGAVSEAIELLRRAIEVAPDYAEAQMNFGNVLQAAGQTTEAMAAYRQTIAIEPDRAQAHYNFGLLLQRTGEVEQATAAYRRAIDIKPNYAEAHNNLGTTLKASGQIDGAIAAFRRAIAAKPKSAESHNNLGETLRDYGKIGEAVAACRRAVEIEPDYAEGFNNLGIALQVMGKHDEALSAVRHAIEIKPDFAVAHFNLSKLAYREADTEASARALRAAVRADPDLAWAHFHLAVICEQQGKAADATDYFARLAGCAMESAHLVDSWNYAKSRRGAATRFHGDPFETLGFALDHAREDGLVLEFGVRFGNSINYIAKNVDRDVHGFDSFQGLPEAWAGYDAGIYTTGGMLPRVASNVRLHVGLFDETLPGFVAEHAGPIRFMNVDCDLYSSTQTIFHFLADRVVPGTVIVFDEYFMNPTWREDEFKAFQEAVESHSWNYEYIAFNLFTKQAAVRIL